MTKKKIDICICTFQRPHIVDTVRSLTRMKVKPEWELRVIVADNDETSSSKDLVESMAKGLPFPLSYIHAPARNISIARNACLDESNGEYLVFIDDDELVVEGWLTALFSKMEETGADAVLGPVHVIYGDDCPEWIRRGNYHARTAVYVGGEITTGYTGNLLLNKTSNAFRNLKFREELGRTGGEDSAFLKAAYKSGAKIKFAPDAIVTEAVPSGRATFSWLAQRRYRQGQTYGMMLHETLDKSFVSLVKIITLALAKAILSFAAAPLYLPWRHRFNFWIFRGIRHLGVVSYLLGRPTLVQHGQ